MDNPFDAYLGLMQTIRNRFDLISNLKTSNINSFLKAEISAFNGRKIVEGISFGCLVAIDNGISHVPRDAKGQWNAQEILNSLEKKRFDTVFPSPSIFRRASKNEVREHNVKIVVEGIPDRRITPQQLIEIYRRLHRWAHELNPYTEKEGQDGFLERHEKQLWEDTEILYRFIEKHTISISGRMFFCVLRDNNDGQVKVLDLTKERDL